MTDSLLGLTILFCLGYIILIGIFTAGWFRIKDFSFQEVAGRPSVSVIVAVRNEARRIGLLIGDLLKQEASFELIIVDDHSDDGTVEVVRRILEKHPGILYRLLKQPDGQTGKKAAIEAGIRASRGELVVTTDGDCRVGPLWVTALAAFYARYHHKFISGPVCYENKKGFLASLSSLEFLSLVGTGAGAIGAGMPIMCNGANLAFEKKVYMEIAATMQGREYASG
ncbi:MAG: glycosyltransferase, partial [Bacteroidetes bacterium]|nr:glycosyltransferase [Bacteroidota bacterium]